MTQTIRYDERHIRFQDYREFTITADEAADICNEGKYAWIYIGGEVAAKVAWHNPEACFNSPAEAQHPRSLRSFITPKTPGTDPHWISVAIPEGPAHSFHVQELAMLVAAAVSTREQ